MSSLIFNEESLLTNNIFKYEQRLQSHANKFIENGAMLTTYYSINEDATTVDRGLRDIEQLFGHKSPLRYKKVLNFPVYGFGQANPSNSDELGIEDINVEGECIILPSTLVPSPNDFFIINHLKMDAIFQVTTVNFDSMKVEGFYKIAYRLISTSKETISNLEKQTDQIYHTDLDAVGSNRNPIVKEDDFIRRGQIRQMVNSMISSYKAMFYNERHNCFLFHNQDTGERWFDLCGNEFIAKHNLMNPENSNTVIILHDKIRDQQLPIYYNNSIYNWLEMDAPKRLLEMFHFQLSPGENYRDSSFARWSEGDIWVIQPLGTHQTGIHNQDLSFFDNEQFESFNNTKAVPTSEFDKLIHKFINKPDNISTQDISLYTADTLLSSIRHRDVFLYTPILIYIIKKILRMN